MSLPYATYNFGLCYCGGTLMCPTVFVVLPSLKVGSRDGTSFSIVCTMCPKTSGPRPPTSMFTQRRPMTCSGTAAVCCGANARHRPPVCKH